MAQDAESPEADHRVTDEAARKALWAEAIAELRGPKLAPDEITLKVLEHEQGIKYEDAKVLMKKLVGKGLATLTGQRVLAQYGQRPALVNVYKRAYGKPKDP